MSKKYEFDEADWANRAFAKKQNRILAAEKKLSAAKAESKFWGSRRGIANKLPGEMADNLKTGAKRLLKKLRNK